MEIPRISTISDLFRRHKNSPFAPSNVCVAVLNWRDASGNEEGARKSQNRKGYFSRQSIPILDFEPIRCRNWAELAFQRQKAEVPLSKDSHPLLWQFIPQIDTYMSVGLFSERGFVRFENYQPPSNLEEIQLLLNFLKVCDLLLKSKFQHVVWCEESSFLDSQLPNAITKLFDFKIPEFDFIRLSHDLGNQFEEKFEVEALPLSYPTSFQNSQAVLISRQGAEKFKIYLNRFGCSLPLDWIIYNVQSEITRNFSFHSYFLKTNEIKIEASIHHSQSLSHIDTSRPQFPNWFISSISNFSFVPSGACDVESPKIRVLQIGVFTGDVTEWLLQNREIDEIHDVDTWRGSGEEHSQLDFSKVENFYDERCQGTTLVRKFKMTSNTFFGCSQDFNDRKRIYDFIYIDGDHTATQTAIDCLHSFSYLKIGGVMAIDDYLWTMKGDGFCEPKLGVDAFLSIIEGRYEFLIKAYQIWIKRTR